MPDEHPADKQKRRRTPQAERKPPMPPRERFLARNVKTIKWARRALARVVKLGNKRFNDYTQDEAQAILRVMREDMGRVEAAFRDVPKEKGLYDL